MVNHFFFTDQRTDKTHNLIKTNKCATSLDIWLKYPNHNYIILDKRNISYEIKINKTRVFNYHNMYPESIVNLHKLNQTRKDHYAFRTNR